MNQNKRERLKIKIITPERIVLEDYADYVSVPGTEGVLGALPGHVPLFTQINEGEVLIKKDSQRIYFSVAGGFVEISGNEVILLADTALNADDLDEEKIREAKKFAEEKMKQKLSKQEYLTAEANLRKILVDLKVATRKRKKS